MTGFVHRGKWIDLRYLGEEQRAFLRAAHHERKQAERQFGDTPRRRAARRLALAEACRVHVDTTRRNP